MTDGNRLPFAAAEAAPMSDPAEAVAGLLRLFDLEPDGDDRWVGQNPDLWPGGRLFGGLVASQAQRAAFHTVDRDLHLHSIHGHFLRAGRSGEPVELAVDILRDGRSFATRGVTASQSGEVIFSLTASFHRPEVGIDYQLPIAADAPRPDEVDDRLGGYPIRTSFSMPFDLREVGPTEPEPDGTYRSTRRVWMKTAVPLADDPVVHSCVLTFMSDMAVIVAARPPEPGVSPWISFSGASLDHAVWFHRPSRADEWFFVDLHAVSNFGNRGMARGTWHTEDGRLVASVAQECLIRSVPKD